MKETSKKLHKLWLIAAMALLITVFLEPANVKAAQPPTDLKQTSASTRSVELGWTAQSGAYGYIIRYAATPNATTFSMPTIKPIHLLHGQMLLNLTQHRIIFPLSHRQMPQIILLQFPGLLLQVLHTT